MPIYEYRCDQCSSTFDLRQPVEDRDDAACPECGQPVTRVIGMPAVHYFGGGFTTPAAQTLTHPEGSRKRAAKIWDQHR